MIIALPAATDNEIPLPFLLEILHLGLWLSIRSRFFVLFASIKEVGEPGGLGVCVRSHIVNSMGSVRGLRKSPWDRS